MDIFNCIRARFANMPIERDFSFARHTCIGCGGRAEVAVYPADGAELAFLISLFKEKHIPHCFLGAGANVLPSDEYFAGAVVRFSRMNELKEENGVYAGAGVTGGALLKFCREREIGGFEAFTGIPMTVGGAIVMNAGVAGRHISDLVKCVYAVDCNGVRAFSRNECCFSEKTSVFQRGIAVVGALFEAERKDAVEIARTTQYYRARRAHLPKGRSMGCTFVNPEGGSAGELIERCKLKGTRIGGAVVSERHANFILNEGASADDVMRLIEKIKEEVLRQTGIVLREEIRRIP